MAKKIKGKGNVAKDDYPDQVTFEELREALSAHKGARNAIHAAALVYGVAVTRPDVSPDFYLSQILPWRAQKEYPAIERSTRLLMALHLIVLESVMAGKTPCLRPASYPATKTGLVQHCDDLLSEIKGFFVGMLGGSEEDEDEFLPSACQQPVGFMIAAKRILEQRRKHLRRRRIAMSEPELAEQQAELAGIANGLSLWKLAYAQGMRERFALLKRMKEPLPVGRNDPCPCGSGKKHKHCCLNKL